jgi:hypothetical protein
MKLIKKQTNTKWISGLVIESICEGIYHISIKFSYEKRRKIKYLEFKEELLELS